ncbi:cytochrome c oxidase subunit 4 isoform 2, mitochondrial-like isoform X2 [Hyposmocoma kahamanoa]|uniref:cytochrome c oxidase subunit 4 isoform 2, mitochondrial-like isoform X2 n=1 Tax=Hyposmocoma kahamanoa TaxID=1477025 RepID=UPI000E6D89A3|nr:cytochrome c oxidase subunit 4 isoform 2, mitochondrial-like isoform X2 [Hyposmocoma kahamanoa]
MALALMMAPKICPKLGLKTMELVKWSRRRIHGTCRIGTRDVVGFGCNGTAAYKDDAHFPFPSIRFQETNPSIAAIRELEKGDWRHLTKEQKKQLYRSSFCQTFSEFQHPTGQWKLIIGVILFLTSWAFWLVMFFYYYVFEPLPMTLLNDSQQQQLKRMLDEHVNPIDGLSSRWNGDRWKRWYES